MVFLVTRFLGDAVRVFASAIPLALVTGWSIPTSIVAMGIVTLVYTWFGGFKAVVWTDVLQLSVYLAGGVGALFIAWSLAGGPAAALGAAASAGKLKLIVPEIDFTRTYTLLGGLLGGALLSAASHGTDHLIVQRLLATRSPRRRPPRRWSARASWSSPSSPSSCWWARRSGPRDWRRPTLPGDELFPRFVVEHLPQGLAGLVVAGILAAAMGTHSSAINSLASSATHDLYASWTGRRDPVHLLRIGRLFSAIWGGTLILGALFFHFGVVEPGHAGRGAGALDRLGDLRRPARHLHAGGALAARDRLRRGGRGAGHGGASCWSVVFAGRLAQAGTDVARSGRPAGLAMVRPARHGTRRRDRSDPELSS